MATKFQAPEFTKMFEGLFANMPTDFGQVTNTANDALVFAGKMGGIALTAAQKNLELSTAWTNDVLTDMQAMTEPQDDITAYAKKGADMMTSQLQSTPERLGHFAEIAKSAQVEATELVMNAGKELQAKFTKAA